MPAANPAGRSAAALPEKTAVHAAAIASALITHGAAESEKRKQRINNTLRISSEKLDEIIQLIGELSIYQGILWHNYQHNTFNQINEK